MCKNQAPLDDDVYRLVYGFQLLNDEGEMRGPSSSLPRQDNPASSGGGTSNSTRGGTSNSAGGGRAVELSVPTSTAVATAATAGTVTTTDVEAPLHNEQEEEEEEEEISLSRTSGNLC
jgi:hypothetical protein